MDKIEKKELKARLKAAKKEHRKIEVSPAERSALAAERNARLRLIQILIAAAAAIAVAGGVFWQVFGA